MEVVLRSYAARLDEQRSQYLAILQYKLSLLCRAFVSWLEARHGYEPTQRDGDDDDDGLVISYNEQGLIRFSREDRRRVDHGYEPTQRIEHQGHGVAHHHSLFWPLAG